MNECDFFNAWGYKADKQFWMTLGLLPIHSVLSVHIKSRCPLGQLRAALFVPQTVRLMAAHCGCGCVLQSSPRLCEQASLQLLSDSVLLSETS